MGLAELTRNAVDVLPKGELERKLALGRPLRVKLGIDVTSPDIHVGRAIPLQRMRAFQDEGHTGVLIVGDYTTRIGDPSGRSTERPMLSDEEIDRNAKTYVEQAMIILDPRPHRGALQRRVARRSSPTRRSSGSRARSRSRGSSSATTSRSGTRRSEPISVSELLYPLMQAYDSVAVEADVELGGTDQLYNLLAGRDVMEAYGLEPQVVLTTPLLLSWDGEKMSSSVGNNIPLTAAPEEQFGRTMRIPDEQLDGVVPARRPSGPCRRATRWRRSSRSRGSSSRARTGRRRRGRPRQHFTRVVREGKAPEEMPEVPLPDGDPVHLPALLAGAFGISTSEARRLIAQGGVTVDGEAVAELDLPRERLENAVLQAGKRRFARLTPA